MTKLIERVQAVLDVFDYSNEKINEHDVYDALSRLESEDLEKDKNSEFVYCAKSMAFSFCEDYSSDSGWGTYYGPMFVLKNEDGQWVEGPSIKLVTQEMLAYWAERSNVAQNPLLSFRYADLAWDFSEKITGKPANYTIAQKVIDATIDFVNKKTYKHEIEAIKKIKRGLHLALSMNDTSAYKRN